MKSLIESAPTTQNNNETIRKAGWNNINCDHIVGEWDDGAMESDLIRVSGLASDLVRLSDVNDRLNLGKDGTAFNFCPMCGEKLNIVDPFTKKILKPDAIIQA